MTPDRYNARVRACFAAPAHAGDLPDMHGSERHGAAVEAGTGQSVRLTAVTDEATLAALRFRVFGCPHLIAAAEAFCERFEGRRVESLADFDLHELVEELDVPVEKTGRMLVLEDAVHELRASLGEEESTNGDFTD